MVKVLPYALAALTATALIASGVALATGDSAISARNPNRDALVWPTLPDNPSLQWTAQLGSVLSVAADEDQIYVMSDPDAGGSTITTLDRQTGDVVDDMRVDELTDGTDIVGVVDGIAVVLRCPESCFSVGVDIEREEVVWEVQADDGWVSLIGDTVVRESDTSLSVLDPATGDAVQTFDGDFVAMDWLESVLYVFDGTSLEAFDAAGDFQSLMGPVEIDESDAFVIVDNLLVVARGSALWTSNGGSELRQRIFLPDESTGIWHGGDNTVLVELDNGKTISYELDDSGTSTRGWTRDGGTVGQLPGSGDPPTLMLVDDEVQIVETSGGELLITDWACCNFGNNGLLLDRDGNAIAYDYEDGVETWSIPSADWVTLVDGGVITIDWTTGKVALYE